MSSNFPPEPNPPPPPNPDVAPPPWADTSPAGESPPAFVSATPRPSSGPFFADGQRWWTTLAVVFISGLAFTTASGIMVVVAFLAVHGDLNTGMFASPDAMQRVLESRIGLFIMVVTPQLALVLPAIVAAYLSPVETRQRLGLVRGQWPIPVWLAAAAATPLIGLLSSVMVGLFLSESHSLKMMSEVFREHGQSGFVIPLALMIGAVPALCEEILFRGYVQTRLTQSAGPAWGILIASILFAAFHMDFVHVIAVLPLGLFLGWISWCSGSLFPAMIGHFVNNVISVIAVVFAPEDQTDVLAVPAMMVSLSIIALGMIGLSVVVVASIAYGRPDQAERSYRPFALDGPLLEPDASAEMPASERASGEVS